MSDIVDRIKSDIASHRVVLFMKGTKSFPQCGFSARVVEILERHGVAYETRNVLSECDVHLFQCHGCVFDHIVKHRRNDDLVGRAALDEEAGDIQRMKDIGEGGGFAILPVVSVGGKLDGVE